MPHIGSGFHFKHDYRGIQLPSKNYRRNHDE